MMATPETTDTLDTLAAVERFILEQRARQLDELLDAAAAAAIADDARPQDLPVPGSTGIYWSIASRFARRSR